mgnify:CR=1 FL=1
MTKPPPRHPSDVELPAAGRLSVRLPSNLGLAVKLAAEARKVPIAGFVRDALLDRLAQDARDAAPTRKA